MENYPPPNALRNADGSMTKFMGKPTYASHYRETLDRCAGVAGGKPVAVFGAGKAGWYVMKMLQARGIEITCFCDNDAGKVQTGFHGCDVLTPNELQSRHPDAVVLVGIFRDESARAVKASLSNRGFTIPEHDVYASLFGYFTEVAARKCDPELLAESLNKLSAYYSLGTYRYGNADNGEFVSPFVTGVVTQRCTLKCYDCGQRIPYYETPADFAVADIVRDIKRYCAAFTLVPEVSLHGGEPLLHPHIGEICRELSSIPNLVFINLITNGSVLPSEATLHDLAYAGADIHQSDYGKLSRKQAEVFSACSRHNVFCDIHFVNSNEKWTRSGPVRPHYRPQEENDEGFMQCVATRICCQIMDGKLFRCPMAAHESAQGKIPDDADNYVQLDAREQKQITADIRQFLSRKKALPACDHCPLGEGTFVTPAIQLSKTNRRILESGGTLS